MLEDPRPAPWPAEVTQVSDASLAGGILRSARRANATAIYVSLDARSLIVLRPAMTCQGTGARKTSLALKARKCHGPACSPISLWRRSLTIQNSCLKMDLVHETRPSGGV